MKNKYEILAFVGGQWVSDAIGENAPRGYEECVADIAAFQRGDCGPEFTDGIYRIREVGNVA